MAELYRLKRFDIFVAYMSYMLYVALNIVVFPLENKVYLSITFYNMSHSLLFDIIFV